MRVIKNWEGDAPWGVLPYLQPEFERLSNEESHTIFFNGVQFIDDKNLRDQYKEYPRRVLFAHWSPCEFMNREGYFYFDAYEFFTDVYCVCPFTVKFMNQYFGEDKFKYIPYPYTNYTLNSFEPLDGTLVSWFGSIHGEDHIKAIELISQYPYKFITSQRNTWMCHPYEFNRCTHVNISTEDKLREVSRTKCSLSFNKLYNSPATKNNRYYYEQHGDGIKVYEHEAFAHFDKGILPQFKVRTHEIASCGSLMLVHKDPWNLIEDFYEPGKDFIYFETFEELRNILDDVSVNYEEYFYHFVANAYETSQQYTVEKIFEYMKTEDRYLVTWRSKYV